MKLIYLQCTQLFTDKLRSFTYEVQQEEGGHENWDNFANGYG